MGLFNNLAGKFFATKKGVDRIPTNEFEKAKLREEVDGKTQFVDSKPLDVKEAVGELAKGGKRYGEFDKGLKDMGLEGKQIEKRKDIEELLANKQ
jgi:hypothetical protein